ncbi:helix-turn-helix domain-containing protein [Micromonospora sp. FIMYZ51]|uniref:helix-turn-helix transcriptional regulator n=1 Tax=Micromonospora sp. FIMYZ51 TaxID=3051832 RepID=UPI00311DDA7E
MGMEGLLTTDQLADRLGIKRTSVHRYRSRGDIPEPDQYVGRTPLWAESSVDAWLKERPGHGWRKGKKQQPPTVAE